MSDYHLPPYDPVYPIRKNVKPRHRKVKFPDRGLEQGAAIGLNQVEPEWSVRWVLSIPEANELDSFFADRALDGNYFLWTPPADRQGRYRCESWNKTLENNTCYQIEAKIIKHYSYECASTRITLSAIQAEASAVRLLRDGNFAIDISIDGRTALIDTWYDFDQVSTAFAAFSNVILFRGIEKTSETAQIYAYASPITFTRNSILLISSVSSVVTVSLSSYDSATGNYFGNLAAQVYGWDRDFQVDWWGD